MNKYLFLIIFVFFNLNLQFVFATENLEFTTTSYNNNYYFGKQVSDGEVELSLNSLSFSTTSPYVSKFEVRLANAPVDDFSYRIENSEGYLTGDFENIGGTINARATLPYTMDCSATCTVRIYAGQANSMEYIGYDLITYPLFTILDGSLNKTPITRVYGSDVEPPVFVNCAI